MAGDLDEGKHKMFTRTDSEALDRHMGRSHANPNTADAILHDIVETTMQHLEERLLELSLRGFGNDPMASVEAHVVRFVEQVFVDNPNPHKLTTVQRIQAEIAAGRGDEPIANMDATPAIGPQYAAQA